MPERSFKELFSSAYQRAKSTDVLTKSLQLSESASQAVLAGRALGHPDFEHLEVGQTATGQGVVLKYEFVFDGKTYSHDLFVFDWEEFGKAVVTQTESLRQRMLTRKLAPVAMVSAVQTVTPPAASVGARTLKDQPT
jgi:hypothetical protein